MSPSKPSDASPRSTLSMALSTLLAEALRRGLPEAAIDRELRGELATGEFGCPLSGAPIALCTIQALPRRILSTTTHLRSSTPTLTASRMSLRSGRCSRSRLAFVVTGSMRLWGVVMIVFLVTWESHWGDEGEDESIFASFRAKLIIAIC